MSGRQVLQLSVFLIGLWQARCATPAGSLPASQEVGGVPVSHLRMLSLGLAHLLQGVEENAKKLEKQGEQGTLELDRATKGLESLSKQSLQTGRTHRQVRKDQQILRARGDRLWMTIRDLQKGLSELKTEQGAMQHQMNQIFRSVKSQTQPSFKGKTQLDLDTMRLLVEKQARRLTALTAEVSARGRLIDERLKHIDHLERQVSERLPAALRPDPDFVRRTQLYQQQP